MEYDVLRSLLKSAKVSPDNEVLTQEWGEILNKFLEVVVDDLSNNDLERLFWLAVMRMQAETNTDNN